MIFNKLHVLYRINGSSQKQDKNEYFGFKYNINIPGIYE